MDQYGPDTYIPGVRTLISFFPLVFSILHDVRLASGM